MVIVRIDSRANMEGKAPRLIVVRARDALQFSNNEDGSVTWAYALAQAHQLGTRPHLARLVHFHGTGKNAAMVVYADFVESQDVGGGLQPLLGFSALEGENPWVPVADCNISRIGQLRIENASEGNRKVQRKTSWVIAIEIVPFDFVYGV